jgi:hypothetical protein
MAEPPQRRRTLLIIAVAVLSFIGAVILGVVWTAGSDEPGDAGRGLDARLASAGRALDDVARDERGELGYALAPLGEGAVVVGGELTQEQAWSAIKVPLSAAFLTFRRETRRTTSGSDALSESDSKLIWRALTESSNKASRRMFRLMAGAGDEASARARVGALLRRGGDERTRVAERVGGKPQLGATRWRIEDALGWYRELARGCLLPASDTELLLGHMRGVVEEQRWGVPEAVGPGTPVAFKGGWGPNGQLSWLVEQFAIVGEGEGAYVIGLMARAAVPSKSIEGPRSFEAGRELVTRAAGAANIDLRRAGPGTDPAGCPA